MNSSGTLIPKHMNPIKAKLLQKPKTLSISVGGIPYKVAYLPWKNVDHNNKAEHLFGQVDYIQHSINIASDVPKEKQQISLIHEVLHAIISEYNIKELQNAEREHSEQAIDQLSLGLLSFLASIKAEVPYGS